LVGANGAGKTTFMRTMLDFIRPTSGSVSVFGLDSRADSVEVRRRTTYLPGELVIPPRLSVRSAFGRFMFARDAAANGRVNELADRLNLDLDRRVGDLSKGNKQKVGLILAFAPPARLLVLDEPTSGLDPLVQREVGELLREAVQGGASVLLSSHVMSEVEQIADRVALMREGRLVAQDDISAIVSQARRRGRVRPRDAQDSQRLALALRATEGVSDVHELADVITFASSGDMNSLIRTLSAFAVTALDISHADLEDAFFTAYDEGNQT